MNNELGLFFMLHNILFFLSKNKIIRYTKIKMLFHSFGLVNLFMIFMNDDFVVYDNLGFLFIKYISIYREFQTYIKIFFNCNFLIYML